MTFFERLKKRKYVRILIMLFLGGMLLGASYFVVSMGAGGYLLFDMAGKARNGQILEAKKSADIAQKIFESSGKTLGFFEPVFFVTGMAGLFEKTIALMTISALTANTGSDAVLLFPNVKCLSESIFYKSEIGGCAWDPDKLDRQAGKLEKNLEKIEVMTGRILGKRTTSFLQSFGETGKKIALSREYITTARDLVKRSRTVLPLVLEIVPKKNETKTYLIVFQNSSELWATGGFIGSFAILKMNHGLPLEYKIYEVYDADGQMKGRVDPPDEILHYLGDNGWFLRSANWSPDFPLTASRLEYFLERETNTKVDGVIGVTLGAAQKLLGAVGPIKMEDGSEVTKDNFFEKAEYASEINFFPGSRQKSQYLSVVAEKILGKLMHNDGVNWISLAEAFGEIVAEKDLQLFLNKEGTAEILEKAGLLGSVDRLGCDKAINNCLMLVETNFGANKANYFVKRDLLVNQEILKNGDLSTKIKAEWVNNAPNNSWPGGDYKNYLRFLIPFDSRRLEMDLNDGKTAMVSPTLTAEIMKSVPSDKFLVVQSTESAHLSYGTLVRIPVKQKREITVEYQAADKYDLGKERIEFRFTLLKQAGAEDTKLQYKLKFPKFLEIESAEVIGNGEKTEKYPSEIRFDSAFSRDIVVKVVFKPHI